MQSAAGRAQSVLRVCWSCLVFFCFMAEANFQVSVVVCCRLLYRSIRLSSDFSISFVAVDDELGDDDKQHHHCLALPSLLVVYCECEQQQQQQR